MEVVQPKVSSIPRENQTFQNRIRNPRKSLELRSEKLLHRRQRTIEIIDNVLDILDAH